MEYLEETICGLAFRSVIAEAQLDPETLEELKDQFMERRREVPKRLVENAVNRGELPKDINQDLLLDMIFGFCWYRLLTDQLRAEEDIDDFINLLINGVCSSPPPEAGTGPAGSAGRPGQAGSPENSR